MPGTVHVFIIYLLLIITEVVSCCLRMLIILGMLVFIQELNKTNEILPCLIFSLISTIYSHCDDTDPSDNLKCCLQFPQQKPFDNNDVK